MGAVFKRDAQTNEEGMKERFTQAVCRIVKTRPTTTYDDFARDFGERVLRGYKRASTVDYLLNSPFKE